MFIFRCTHLVIVILILYRGLNTVSSTNRRVTWTKVSILEDNKSELVVVCPQGEPFPVAGR